ncbi:hypothetical protein AJ87_09860 [Rhizobium yanglingense]|nr:hypothetical protein AJ87_09860 [Rhizobium yanglingense]
MLSDLQAFETVDGVVRLVITRKRSMLVCPLSAMFKQNTLGEVPKGTPVPLYLIGYDQDCKHLLKGELWGALSLRNAA